MHRTESDNKIVVGGLNQFTNGPPGTTRDAVDVNTGQEEIAYVIEQAGLTLKTVATETNTQLKEAIDLQIVSVAPNTAAVDFESNDLIINVQSVTTVDADAKRLSLLNTSYVPAFIDNLDTTFNIATDLMAGTSEKASHWYQLWIDSGGNRLMVPDLTGAATATTASKLVVAGADFVTDLVQVGDIVFNTTDLTQTTVTQVDNLTTLSLAADIMANGENYTIHTLSPTGLATVYKANIGAVYNDSGSNLDNYNQAGDFVTAPQTAVLTAGTSAVVVLVSLSAVVPITAKSVSGYIVVTEANGASAEVALFSTLAGRGRKVYGITTNEATNDPTFSAGWSIDLSVKQSIYYDLLSGDSVDIFVTGWTM